MAEFSPITAIITGSDSGIGRACAVHLARAGMDVGITYSRDEEGARETARLVEAEGRRAEVAHLDLTDIGSNAATIDDLAERLGGVDVFVNNSGTGGGTAFLELGYDEWIDTMDVDLNGAFVCMQAAAKRMVAADAGGRIVAITSVHEHQPRYGAAAYDAAKHGLGGLVKTAAIELGQHGITVNSVAPGEIATPMTGATDEDPREESRPGVPLGRPGDANEMAAVVAFLASPQSSYVTGASFVADGGMLLMGPHGGSHITSDDWRSAE